MKGGCGILPGSPSSAAGFVVSGSDLFLHHILPSNRRCTPYSVPKGVNPPLCVPRNVPSHSSRSGPVVALGTEQRLGTLARLQILRVFCSLLMSRLRT